MNANISITLVGLLVWLFLLFNFLGDGDLLIACEGSQTENRRQHDELRGGFLFGFEDRCNGIFGIEQ